MPKSASVTRVLADLSSQVVEIQKLWDAAHQVSEEQGQPWSARMFSRSTEIDLRTRMTLDRTGGFSIRVQPLNLGTDLRFGRSEQRECRLRMTVEQVPSRGELAQAQPKT